MNGSDFSHDRVYSEGQHWLALKLAWSRLTPESRRLDLDDEAIDYFTGLSARYFEKALGCDGVVARFRIKAPPPSEVWNIVFREFYLRRTRTGQRVLDDIYMRAFDAARRNRQGDSIEGVVGYLKKQFELRLRDVVRSWVREQIGPIGDSVPISINTPIGGSGDGAVERTGLDIMADSSDGDELNPEIRDLRRIGKKEGVAMFDRMADLPKTVTIIRACVALQEARVTLAHPVVVATLGKGRAVLYDHLAKLHQQVADWATNFDDPDLDQEGRRHLAIACFRELCNRCENWFFSEMSDSPLFSLVTRVIPPAASTSNDTPS